MKIFAIKDETDNSRKTLGWLIYYEQAGQFYIELPEEADPWETPLLLSSFLKKGETSINGYWSRLWVEQRIVPMDRQNLGQVLKDNRLKEYDEYALLMLGSGRCAQDSYYLESVDRENLPKELASRFEKKVEDVIPLANENLLIFFCNGTVKKFNMEAYTDGRIEFIPLRDNDRYFKTVAVSPGGNEICWDSSLAISAAVLYKEGTDIPLEAGDFARFIETRVVSGTEAAEMLNCSRQNIDDLIRRDKLHPVKTSPKTKLFLRSEIEQRMRHETE